MRAEMVCRSQTAPKRSTSQTNAATVGTNWGRMEGDRGIRGFAVPPPKATTQISRESGATRSIIPWHYLWPRTWNGDNTRQEWKRVALALACGLLRQRDRSISGDGQEFGNVSLGGGPAAWAMELFALKDEGIVRIHTLGPRLGLAGDFRQEGSAAALLSSDPCRGSNTPNNERWVKREKGKALEARNR